MNTIKGLIQDGADLVVTVGNAVGKVWGTPFKIRVTNRSNLNVDVQYYDLHWESNKTKLLENQSKVMDTAPDPIGRRCYHCRVWQDEDFIGTFCVFGDEVVKDHNEFELRNVNGRIQPFFNGNQVTWADGGH
jgi:hypothetical protein